MAGSRECFACSPFIRYLDSQDGLCRVAEAECLVVGAAQDSEAQMAAVRAD